MSNELNVIINKKCETCDHKEVCRFQSDHMHTVIAKNTVEKALKDANTGLLIAEVKQAAFRAKKNKKKPASYETMYRDDFSAGKGLLDEELS